MTNAQYLRSRGWSVEPSDIPGLWWWNGQEVTSGQLADIAARDARGEYDSKIALMNAVSRLI